MVDIFCYTCLQRASANLLEDDRFNVLFEDKEFQIDTTSEEYRLLNPVMARLESKKERQNILDKFDQVEEVSPYQLFPVL